LRFYIREAKALDMLRYVRQRNRVPKFSVPLGEFTGLLDCYHVQNVAYRLRTGSHKSFAYRCFTRAGSSP